MDYVGSLDLSPDLQLIYAKSFLNRLHLVLHVYIEIFDVTVFLCLRVYGVGTKPGISGKRLTCNFHDLFVNTLAIRVCKHSRNCRPTQQSLKPVYTFYAPAKLGHFQCVARVLLEKGRKLRCWGPSVSCAVRKTKREETVRAH